jgi:hypothetical protein
MINIIFLLLKHKKRIYIRLSLDLINNIGECINKLILDDGIRMMLDQTLLKE